MLEHDELRKVLQTQAVAVTQTIGLNCRIGEESFTEPTDGTPYAEFWIRTGKTLLVELGALTGYERTPGLIQFTIFTMENMGEGLPLRLGGLLKKAFNRKQWLVPPDGFVRIDPVSVQEISGVRKGVKTVIVDATFDFYHRDPDATA